ncbi:(R)-2-hydroxyglutarate--pyruvate transhydrogenase [Malassezia psittaci]|uniref:(R)-2-hydroxyglutarate--pyruvate transhydrogenase n=1 Tax=Malassezia psittaci TaxID=1821823 RepID=A0AAF0F858_9BASI|nr:(R)-2-hydroxyglutarate--pyruvate transhydrogenase [Malassezia psittaci]
MSEDDAPWSILDGSDLDTYNKDWMGKYAGNSACVVRPKSTAEVSRIMQLCNTHGIAVVPQGGNTGLVGGSVPVHDEVVMNLGGMSQVRSFDPVSGTLVCDAGCILEVLDDYVAKQGYMMPLDLGAKGSCQIGGNVATNAGGLRYLRYGSLHGSVLGLEVVLADGKVLPLLQTLRKDNTGFDLKQLFIGSEGTIGIITGVSIATPRRARATNVAVFGVESYEAVQKTFQMVRSHCGEILSALEFIDSDSYAIVQQNPSAPRDPFSDHHPMYVLIETSGSNHDHDQEKLQGLLEELLESNTVSDGVLAQDETQIKSLWALRESVPESLGHYGKVYKYDISIPVEKMYDLVLALRARFTEYGVISTPDKPGPVKAVCGYGHIGDGNLHVNIVAERYEPEIEAVIEPYIYEWVAKVNGSISAEHGLGVMKADKIGYTKDQLAVEYMQKIKSLFDPKGLLNPYKYDISVSAGATGFAVGIAGAVLCGAVAQRRVASIRSLPLSVKGSLVLSSGLAAGVINAERSAIAYEQKTFNDSSAQIDRRLRELHDERWSQLSTLDRTIAWAKFHKFKVVIGSWLTSMAGSWLYIQSQPLSFSQKIVQARVWAQGLTLASLLVMAGVTQFPTEADELLEEEAQQANHSWRNLIHEDNDMKSRVVVLHDDNQREVLSGKDLRGDLAKSLDYDVDKIQDLARQIETDSSKAMKGIKQGSQEMYDDATNAAREAAVDARDEGKDMAQAARGAVQEVAEAGRGLSDQAEEAANDAGKSAKDTADNAASTAKNAGQDAGAKAQDLKDSAKDATNDVKDKAQDMAGDAKDKAQDAKDAAKDKAQDAKDVASDAKDAAKDKAQDAKDAASDMKDSAKDKAKDATGAANDVKEDAKDAAKQVKDNAKDAAENAKDNAKDTGEKASEVAKDAGEKAQDVAKETKEKLK